MMEIYWKKLFKVNLINEKKDTTLILVKKFFSLYLNQIQIVIIFERLKKI